MNEKLPFEDESFEGVTSVWANRFIKDTDAFLSDVHRILKPGGVFVWPIFPTEQPIWKWKNGMAQHTSTKSLRSDALRIGFSEVQIEHVSLGEARARKFPLHTIPHYLLARK